MGAEHGPTLMLVHGFGCDQNLWRLVADRTQSRTSVWSSSTSWGRDCRTQAAWDATKYSSLSGYAADILDILDELDLRDVVFVGHSVSAMIGALATITDPARFAKLVLLTLPLLHRRRRLPRRIFESRHRRTPRVPGAELPWLVARNGTRHHGHPGPARTSRMNWRDTFCQHRPGVRARIRRHHVPVGQSRRPRRGYRCRPWLSNARRIPSRRREVGAYVHAHISGQSARSLWTPPDIARTSAPRRPPHRRSPPSPAQRDRRQR